MSVQGKNRLGHQFLEGKFKYTKNPQHLADYLYYSCVYRSLSHPLLEKHYDLEAIEDRPFVRVSKFLSGVTFAGIADRFLFSTSLPSLKATVMRFLLGIGVASSLGFSVGKAFNHLPRDFLARSSYAALNLDKRTPLGDVAYHVRLSFPSLQLLFLLVDSLSSYLGCLDHLFLRSSSFSLFFVSATTQPTTSASGQPWPHSRMSTAI
jgi:hypothetical protein